MGAGFLLLVVLSGFFSGSEIALVSASRARLEKSAAEGRRDARRALDLLADTQGMIAVLLVGNNLINTAVSALATAVAVSVSPERGVALATLLVTSVLLFAGEIVPKAVARGRPTRWMRLASSPLALARFLLRPGVAVASGATRLLLAVLPIPAAEQRPVFKRDDLESLFLYGSPREEGRAAPSGEWFRMAGRALELGRRRTAEAMVPIRPERTCRANGTVGEALEYFRRGGARYLAAVDDAGNVEGFIAAKALLGRGAGEPLRPHLRAAYVLDPDRPLDEAIQGFRRHQQSIALVRSREGRSLGLVTTEDVFEEIVGELRRSVRPSVPPPGRDRA
jgi:putative hemolysin